MSFYRYDCRSACHIFYYKPLTTFSVYGNQIDIAIVDYFMPEQNGYVLCQKLRDNPKTAGRGRCRRAPIRLTGRRAVSLTGRVVICLRIRIGLRVRARAPIPIRHCARCKPDPAAGRR